jgi:VCBS repeat protein/FG-GAP repeat protein
VSSFVHAAAVVVGLLSAQSPATTASSETELRAAWARLTPGSTIVLRDGAYHLSGRPFVTAVGGSAASLITIRAEHPLGAVISTDGAEEAFLVLHPWYVFEGLAVEVTGGSAHAYKFDGASLSRATAGSDAVVRGGRCTLSAAAESCVKGSTRQIAPYCDRVRIEDNEIAFSAPSTRPVAEGVDAIGVADWRVTGNRFINIKRTAGIAYAVVLKGNSVRGVIERNVFVDCGIAVSVGGTTAPEFCRDKVCTYEHRSGVVRYNTVVRTEDVAFYLERAARTLIAYNTIIEPFERCGTGCSSIDVRYLQSTAVLRDNVLWKRVNARDGGTFTETGTVLVQQALVPTPPPAPPPTPPPTSTTVPVIDALVEETNHGLPGMYYGNVVAADLDGDGWPDIAMTGNYERKFDSADGLGGRDQVRLYRNASNGLGGRIHFELRATPTLGGIRGSQLAVGDFDGDGRQDIVVEFRNGDDTTALLNRGGWSFEVSTLAAGFGVHSTGLGLAAGDVNRDGRADVVFLSDGGGSTGLWYSYDPAARVWAPHQTDFAHAISYGGAIALGDVDGDGFLDLAVGGNSSAPFGSLHCMNLMIGGLWHGTSGGFAPAPITIIGNWGLKESAASRQNMTSCHGQDNAGLAIVDVDKDGKADIIVAGSSTGLNGSVGMNGQQYDLAVLFGDGTGKGYTTFEAEGPQSDYGTTNGGPGNLDEPNIAVGDLTGDGLPDIVVQGHHRDYFDRPTNPYVYATWVFVNRGDRTFDRHALPIPTPVGEGGQAIADFNRDGKPDLVFTGATIPFHSNGVNYEDRNTAATLKAYVFRQR